MVAAGYVARVVSHTSLMIVSSPRGKPPQLNEDARLAERLTGRSCVWGQRRESLLGCGSVHVAHEAELGWQFLRHRAGKSAI